MPDLHSAVPSIPGGRLVSVNPPSRNLFGHGHEHRNGGRQCCDIEVFVGLVCLSDVAGSQDPAASTRYTTDRRGPNRDKMLKPAIMCPPLLWRGI